MGKKKNGRLCLVLNKNGLAIDVGSVSHVIRKVQGKRAVILDPVTFERYTIEQWVARGASSDTCIHAERSFDAPEVVVCTFYDDTHPVVINCNKANVLKRDGYRCSYCGKKTNLTVDHVVPQCEGGRLVWNNLVASCQSCNNMKDRMSVEEFCAQMGCEIPHAWNPNAAPWLFKAGYMEVPKSWKQFINI